MSTRTRFCPCLERLVPDTDGAMRSRPASRPSPEMHRLDAEILAALDGPVPRRRPPAAAAGRDDYDGFDGFDGDDGGDYEVSDPRAYDAPPTPPRETERRAPRLLPRGVRMTLVALLALLSPAAMYACLEMIGGSGSESGSAASASSSGSSSPPRRLGDGAALPLPTGAAILPELRSNLADLTDPRADGETAVFWHVLKSGGTTVKDLMSECLRLTAASEVGALNGHGDEDELRVVEVNEGQRHVNVDVTTPSGIERAGRMGLARSGLADVVFTPLPVEAASRIFDPQRRGRMFATFRHPVHRAVSQFYYLRTATWEPTYSPEYGEMTLAQWAFTPLVESNWMVRSLVGKMEAPLTDEDIDAAKETLRTKCLIGLLDRMEESVDRFRRYFDFGAKEGAAGEREECVKRWVSGDGGRGSNHNGHPFPIQPGDDAWKELEKKNHADLTLYLYAKTLFEEQKVLVDGQLNVAEGATVKR